MSSFILALKQGSNVPYSDRREFEQAGAAPPLGSLLRPPRHRKPHEASHQAILRGVSNPIPRRLRRRFHSVAQFTPPQTQIPRPRILHSGTGPTSRTRQRRRNLQCDGA